MAINRKENFGVEGFRIQRNNPDGTIPTPLRMVGTSGDIDVSALAGTETIILKEDNNAAVSEAIDITGGTYSDDEHATVTELVTAINTALGLGSLNLTVEEDGTTGRLSFKLTTAGTTVKVQLYGTLISYLGLGTFNGDQERLTGVGLKIIKGFDTTKAIGLPKSIKDKESIENETGDGSLTEVIVNAIVKGLTPTITCAKNDLELKQMIMDGVYDTTENTYEPPTIDEQTSKPSCNVEIFSPAYDTGSNLKTNISAWEQILLRTVVGYEGDVSKEVKAFTDTIYNLDATEYTNESGVKMASYKEKQLTLAEYANLDVENV